MDISTARSIVLTEFACEEYDHLGKSAYRNIPKKKGGKPGRTFMTLWIEDGFAVLMLNLEQQTGLIEQYLPAFEAHPGKWGEKGATIMRLEKVGPALFTEAVTVAYSHAGR